MDEIGLEASSFLEIQIPLVSSLSILYNLLMVSFLFWGTDLCLLNRSNFESTGAKSNSKMISNRRAFNTEVVPLINSFPMPQVSPCFVQRARSTWYVSNVSIIFYAPCLFLHHLPDVSLHFVTLLCIFRN
jgi:hypothetical protein